MSNILAQINERLEPAEEIFFKWLNRIFISGILIGSAWIDDAPPLVIAAFILTLYIFIRVMLASISIYSVAPFNAKVAKTMFAILSFGILGLSFLTVATFVERISIFVVG